MSLKVFACLLAVAHAAIPVIIDTDIGSDFDDSAAIALALADPTLDIKLIITATGDTTARAKIVAKYLDLVGRSDIPIGIGIPDNIATANPLYGWAAAYNLTNYPGAVYDDGVGAMMNIIHSSPTPVSLLAIAPATNFPSLLSQAPDVVHNAAVYAMSGSIYRGYYNSTTPTAEYNVLACPTCSAAMYGAGWPVFTTPLDTCGTMQLQGDAYNTFLSSSSPIGAYLAECYTYWSVNGFWDPRPIGDVWYDSVATLLLTPEAASVLNFQSINVTITPDGYTVVAPPGSGGFPISAALTWKAGGEAAFETWVANAVSTGTTAGNIV